MLNRRLTTEERQKVSSMIAELQSRNILIPNELKLDKSVTWPKDSDGYFVKIDGRRYTTSNQAAVDFVKSNARFVALISGRGGGKSASGSQKAIEKIRQGQSGAVLNPDFENFKISTWPEFREWIPWDMVVKKHKYRRHPSWTPTQPFTIAFTNNVTVICKGLKNPDAARGPNINWLWYDEAQRDPDGLSWKIANASVRVGNDPQSWASYTPNGKLHWTYEFFEEREIPEEIIKLFREIMGEDRDLISVYHGSIDDNKDNLSPDF
jgi:phage terminase large subunit